MRASEALLLGAVQGLTEVVPVSSSAHLTLLPWLLGQPPAPDRTALAAGLHAGSCLGIALGLRRDLPGPRTAALALATSLPAALAGLLAADAVEARLGRPRQVAVLLGAAGAAMALADRRPQLRPVGPREAAWAALAQVTALAPGVSRSGACLTALRLAGVRRRDAERFALLMSLPITAGAAGLALLRAEPAVLRALVRPLALGAPAAALAAWAGVVRLGPRGGRPLAGPAVYRLAVAALVIRTTRRRDRA